MERLDEFAARTLNDLAALPEDGMRLELLGRRLAPLASEEIARFFDILYKKGVNETAALRVKAALIDPEGLKRALGEERYREVLRASLDLGLRKVSRLFSELPPHKKGVSGYDKEEEAKMEFISLGARRALSKKTVKDTIDRLLSDPDPVVINNILNNPRTTEKEALKIASKRPNSPGILKLLAGHRKWSKSYNVIKAIALNPYTPPRISIAILETLLTQDLKLISQDSTVHPQVRISAKDIIEQKKGG